MASAFEKAPNSKRPPAPCFVLVSRQIATMRLMSRASSSPIGGVGRRASIEESVAVFRHDPALRHCHCGAPLPLMRPAIKPRSEPLIHVDKNLAEIAP